MIVYMLDINLMLALFDPGHEHHHIAHQWYGGNRRWASCPITENGFIRIASSASYPGSRANPALVADQLRAFQRASKHVFWEDLTSLLDPSVFRLEHLRSSKQATDIYLLGLAKRKRGKLATLDQHIPFDAVVGGKEALELLPLPARQVES